MRDAELPFTIDAFEETPYDEPAEGPRLTRVVVRKTYSGPFEGRGTAHVLTAQGAGSGFVASERLEGRLAGLAGTFVIQHRGVARPDGTTSVVGTIIPASGTGDLATIAGEASEGAPGVLSLRYEL